MSPPPPFVGYLFLGIALWLGYMLEGAVVQELNRFLKAKAEAAPERADEISGGMGSILNSSVYVCLFMFVCALYFGIIVLTGWSIRYALPCIILGYIAAFFVYCLSSVPIGYIVWWFKYRQAEAKQASQEKTDNPPQE